MTSDLQAMPVDEVLNDRRFQNEAPAAQAMLELDHAGTNGDVYRSCRKARTTAAMAGR